MARLLGGSHTHTWRGFVRDATDAAVLVEACIRNLLPTQQSEAVSPASASSTLTNAGPVIENGTVVVFQFRESDKTFESDDAADSMARWRDNRRWSPSRPQGAFLLYREVEPLDGPMKEQSHEKSTRFVNISLRGNRRFVPNGLAKRSISIIGSNNLKYRVIHYFHPDAVESLYTPSHDSQTDLICPSDVPQFSELLPIVHQLFEQQGGPPKRKYGPGGTKRTKVQGLDEFMDTKRLKTQWVSPNGQWLSPNGHGEVDVGFRGFGPPNFSIALDSSVFVRGERQCICGGCGKLKRFCHDPFWPERPVRLAPLAWKSHE
ncbi:hypothetical protein HDU82_004945 [Entophlyctis luteolus]|nr:hypothetical protein HDU82_004945 [Entophlyctis luteolus]